MPVQRVENENLDAEESENELPELVENELVQQIVNSVLEDEANSSLPRRDGCEFEFFAHQNVKSLRFVPADPLSVVQNRQPAPKQRRSMVDSVLVMPQSSRLGQLANDLSLDRAGLEDGQRQQCPRDEGSQGSSASRRKPEMSSGNTE